VAPILPAPITTTSFILPPAVRANRTSATQFKGGLEIRFRQSRLSLRIPIFLTYLVLINSVAYAQVTKAWNQCVGVEGPIPDVVIEGGTELIQTPQESPAVLALPLGLVNHVRKIGETTVFAVRSPITGDAHRDNDEQTISR